MKTKSMMWAAAPLLLAITVTAAKAAEFTTLASPGSALDAEEAVLEVRVKSLQTELVAKQVEKELLARTTQSRERELLRGQTRVRELRGADAGPGDRHDLSWRNGAREVAGGIVDKQ